MTHVVDSKLMRTMFAAMNDAARREWLHEYREAEMQYRADNPDEEYTDTIDQQALGAMMDNSGDCDDVYASHLEHGLDLLRQHADHATYLEGLEKACHHVASISLPAIPSALAGALVEFDDDDAYATYQAWRTHGGADDDAAGFKAFIG